MKQRFACTRRCNRRRIILRCGKQAVYGRRESKKVFPVINSKDFASIHTFVSTEVPFSSLNGLVSQDDRLATSKGRVVATKLQISVAQ